MRKCLFLSEGFAVAAVVAAYQNFYYVRAARVARAARLFFLSPTNHIHHEYDWLEKGKIIALHVRQIKLICGVALVVAVVVSKAPHTFVQPLKTVKKSFETAEHQYIFGM